MAPNYDAVGANNNPSPYGSGDPYYNESSGFITPHPAKRRTSNWIKFGIPVLVIVIIGAVVGGVVGSRHKNNNNSVSSSSNQGAGSSSGEAAASSAASAKLAIGRFATATDSFYMVPVYPSTVSFKNRGDQYLTLAQTNAAAFTIPTFTPSSNSALAWPKDPFQPPTPSVLAVRPDRPRLIAPAYKWQTLPALIPNDPYLKGWNDTIFGNASAYYGLPPVVYHLDGASGILDNAREVKMRLKAFSYVYRMTNDTKWVDRAWVEIQASDYEIF